MRLLRGARGEGHGRWLGASLDHRRVGDVRALDRRRVARGCPRGAVPVVQRVELDADAGHGRQQPARIVPRVTERHSTAEISGAARGPFAAAAEERALRPDLLLHLRRARGRPDDARTRGSRASRVRHPAPSVELLNRSRGGGLDFRPSRERLWAQRVEKLEGNNPTEIRPGRTGEGDSARVGGERRRVCERRGAADGGATGCFRSLERPAARRARGAARMGSYETDEFRAFLMTNTPHHPLRSKESAAKTCRCSRGDAGAHRRG